MPFVELPVTFETPLLEVADAATKAELDTKGWNEIVWSFDAVQTWASWFFERNGSLVKLRHRSNPDDPPDLDLVFERITLGLEHTSLKPAPLGHAQAIASEINPAGGRIIPPISKQWTRKQLEGFALGLDTNEGWANVSDEHETASKSLENAIRRKIERSTVQIIVVTNEASHTSAYAQWLAFDLWQRVNAAHFKQFGDRIVIFHTPCNHIQFFSALIRRGEPIKAQRDGKEIATRRAFHFEEV